LGSLAIILVILVSCELLAFLATLFLQHRSIIFCPLEITEPYEMYQKRFLPTLGWPSPDFFHQRPGFYDASGSRMIPAFPDPFRTPPVSPFMEIHSPRPGDSVMSTPGAMFYPC
jgi:hypothetical protein